MELKTGFETAPETLPASPLSHYQHPAYAGLLMAYGQTPRWLVVRDKSAGRILATWLLFETPGNYLSPPASPLARYVDVHLNGLHGPVIAPDIDGASKSSVIGALLDFLRHYLRRLMPISAKIWLDPIITADELDLWDRLASERGFSTHKNWSYIAELPRQPDQLLSMIKSDRRTKIRKAEKAGLQFRQEDSLDALKTYCAMRLQTLKRNHHAALPFAHFADTFQAMAGTGMFKIFIAEGDKPAAGQLAFAYDKYLHLTGVSIADWCMEEGVPANDFLQWNVLKWAQDNGLSYVDFVGADPDSTDPKIRAIDAFKSRWGTELHQTLALSWSSFPIRRYALAVARRMPFVKTC